MNKPSTIQLPDLIAVQPDSAEMDRSKTAEARQPTDVLSVYTQGGPRYRLNSKVYSFSAPVAILLPSGSIDNDLQSGKIHGLCALFQSNGMVKLKASSDTLAEVSLGGEVVNVPLLKQLSNADAAKISGLLNELGSVSGSGVGSLLKRTAKLYEAIAEYCLCPDRSDNKAIHREAIRLREMIQAFAFENTSLEKVYSELELSPAHAETLFRKAFGIKPVAFRMQLRLRRARELLAASKLNVSQVAYATGFTDPLYFSRLFRRFYGVTPSSLITEFDYSRRKALPR
jgi:AraC-like DNA-binding protein